MATRASQSSVSPRPTSLIGVTEDEKDARDLTNPQISDVENGLRTLPPDTTSVPVLPDEFEDNSNVPRLSAFRLFWLFFSRFGIFAWGGPMAQIALLKEQLVLREKWITLPRFNRVFSVYQMLPGPEAAELCMFFGCLSGGRWGGVAAGLGFILPGFILMLIASYLYTVIGFGNAYVDASFRALQPMVGAMMLRATHKIAEHALLSHETKRPSVWLFMYAILTAINSALRINWLISLGIYGLINMAISRRYFSIGGILFVLQYVGYAIYVVFKGVPSPLSLALGVARTPDSAHLFLLGVVAGSLSFGGAFTAIPFINAEAVLLGKWLDPQVFADCIAIGNVLPAPLVIFATFVGFQGGYKHAGLGSAFIGATVITLGMFFPCFLFTIVGHHWLEKLVRNKFLSAFFDGICGAVVGIISIVAVDFMKVTVGSTGRTSPPLTPEAVLTIASQDALAAVLYLLSLAALYKFTHKYAVIVLVLACAIAGQFLFV